VLRSPEGLLARKWQTSSSEHVSQPLAGGNEERGAKLLTEGSRQGLRLLAVIAVALQQHACGTSQ
jgi:hypothetical protein